MSWNEETASLLRRGDPAGAVDPNAEQRISARLNQHHERPRRNLRWVIVLASLGAFGVLAATAVGEVIGRLAPKEAPAATAPPAAKPPSPPASTLADEALLLQGALADLERGDGEAALRTIDLHALRFPSGELLVEFQVARARAMLISGDDAGAVNALRALPAFARTNALAVLEAQALARLHRCSEFREVVERLEEGSAAGSCSDR